MKELDPLAFPLVPTLIDGFPAKENTVYYVGNGETFHAAGLRRGVWCHAVKDSPLHGTPIDSTVVRYVLCAQEDTVVFSDDAPRANETSVGPREGEDRGSWDCGNRHLHDQLTLLLVANGRIRDEAAIQAISGHAYEAGVTFCKEMVETLRPSNCEVPF